MDDDLGGDLAREGRRGTGIDLDTRDVEAQTKLPAQMAVQHRGEGLHLEVAQHGDEESSRVMKLMSVRLPMVVSTHVVLAVLSRRVALAAR